MMHRIQIIFIDLKHINYFRLLTKGKGIAVET